MSFHFQLTSRSTLFAITGFAFAGLLSACGGGGTQSPPPIEPVTPPGNTTKFGRIGMDVQLFSNTPSNSIGGLLGATVDSSANITITNLDHQIPDSPEFNYNFDFPSGLPGGSISGNLFTFTNGSANKVVNLLAPGTTKFAQNVLWRDKDDPTLFGLGAAGYIYQIDSQNWPTTGTATYAGKAFQYIVDSNADNSTETTYALYTSEATALVDYSAKTISIAIAPDPIFISSIGNPEVVNTDPSLFSANYEFPASSSNFFTGSYFSIPVSDMPSGLGLPLVNNALAFFGGNAEEIGGYVRYSGDITIPAGEVTRDQFISFALVKK